MLQDICDSQRDGLINKEVFFAGLRRFFPIKSEQEMRTIQEIVFAQMQTRGENDEWQVREGGRGWMYTGTTAGAWRVHM